MTHDDSFEPSLGKIRSQGSKRGKKYLHQVMRSTALAGGSRTGAAGGKRRFDGSRIGRGAGVGRMLATRDQYAAFRSRRVVVKSRIVKLAGNGVRNARAHLRYIQRDGVTRDGEPGALYSADLDTADGRAFLERGAADRHQFRFIVAPEDGAHYDNLKPLIRRLMGQVEEDLGTKLDWVAVDHYNTGHPHSHIIVRGKDDQGKDLIIARDYIGNGLRERAAELVTMDLGPQSDLEIQNRLRREVDLERLTSIDRRLLRDRDEDGLVRAADRDAFQQTLRAGRLQKLKAMELADEVRAGTWRLADDLEDTLRRMGERGDIVRTLQREMTAKGLARAASDHVIFDPAASEARPITGRVIARGLSDEINDRHYLIVDALDGRTHYIDIGKGDTADPMRDGAIVRIEPKTVEPRAVDHTVADIAAANGGRYSVDIHLAHDRSATAAFAETHVRRLEAMRRLTGAIEREADGTWLVPSDHLERAAAFERQRTRAAPVTVRTLCPVALEQQIAADGATWLDRELIATTPEAIRDEGFGREVQTALSQRRQWLIEQGFAELEQDRIVYRANMLATLRRRELTCTGKALSDASGLAYTETRSGDRVEGIYRRSLDLASGRFAVIEKSREFTLVPWRPVLDRHIGKQVSGIVRGDQISWTIGRQKGMGIS